MRGQPAFLPVLGWVLGMGTPSRNPYFRPRGNFSLNNCYQPLARKTCGTVESSRVSKNQEWACWWVGALAVCPAGAGLSWQARRVVVGLALEWQRRTL